MSTFPSWARVGAKVVCVDARPVAIRPTGLREGSVYTIVWVGAGRGTTPSGRSGAHVVIDLAEVKNPWDAEFPDTPPGFALERFRPLITVSQEDDVAIFAPFLTTEPVA